MVRPGGHAGWVAGIRVGMAGWVWPLLPLSRDQATMAKRDHYGQFSASTPANNPGNIDPEKRSLPPSDIAEKYMICRLRRSRVVLGLATAFLGLVLAFPIREVEWVEEVERAIFWVRGAIFSVGICVATVAADLRPRRRLPLEAGNMLLRRLQSPRALAIRPLDASGGTIRPGLLSGCLSPARR